MRQLDGIDGAGLLAHAAIDAPEFIDVELGGVFFAIGPGTFGGLDVDAVGRAGRGTHETGDAFDPAFVVLVEAMNAAICFEEHSSLFDGQVFAFFFRILNHAILAANHDVEHVAHRRSQPDE